MDAPAKTIARRLLPHSLYRRYRKHKVASLIADYTTRDVTHKFGRATLLVHLADPLAEGWYDHDWDELAAISFLRDQQVLAPGATVFDVGAHQAVVALMLAHEVGEAGQVVAIEAEPHNARVAALNRDLNKARNLTVRHAAGASNAGVISFANGLNGQIDERTTAGNVNVIAVTVDGLAQEYGRPDLVFIDVEGYEGHVLRGATSTLANGSTSFLVEVHDALTSYGGSSDEIADCFLGFDRYVAIAEHEPFVALKGLPHAGRFFLIAIPATGDRHEPARPDNS